ncbi:SDR family oxidoreductase, partial [Actinomadura sp. BRA 177]|uniref:SDR family oxidoreductase n=1 Tax=Actinomadura sp. BRA 177 TaxID=2745202 RepID=UPI002815F1F7
MGYYNVTKAAGIHLSRQFAMELAPKVRVNCIAPGLVKTHLAPALWEQSLIH